MSNETVEGQSLPEVALPERFTDLGLDRYFYKPDSCKDKPLIGVLIGVEEMNRKDPDPKEWWDALIFRTTEPTLVVQKDKEGNDEVIECPVGEEVMIGVSDKLVKLKQYARHKTKQAEFFIQPLRKDVLEINPKTKEVTKSIWRYKVGGGLPFDRTEVTSWDTPALPAKEPDGGAALPG